MKLHALKTYLVKELCHLYTAREAQTIAEMVLEQLTGWSRIAQLLNREELLEVTQADEVYQKLTLLKEGVPIQQVLGEAWFYDLCLHITPDVLIPRPETEELVLWVVERLKREQTGVKVLDIGTGSGCIPLLIKYLAPNSDVWAVDISEKALTVANNNAARLQLPIQFMQLDILNPADWKRLANDFDVIISNPPYIPQQEKASLSTQVLQYEPELALFVADDRPLLFYETIAQMAQQHLKKGGSLYFEIHEQYGKAAQTLLEAQGYHSVQLRQDMQGKDRMLYGKK